MALDINTAGGEFVKCILTLYRSAKYFREKEILAKKLVAGNLINQVGTCAEHERGAVAGYALVQLSKAMFIVKIMGEEGIYPKRRTKTVDALAQQITDLLTMYKEQSPVQPANPQPAAPVQPVVPVYQVDDDSTPLLRYIDNDGFNEVYDGKLIKF